LASGFEALAKLGIVNRDNINEYAAAFKDQFDQILGKTKDQNTALAAMGPQIGMLLDHYRELGIAVPDWLTDIADKAVEAGASLEPPEGLPDILKDIRDILRDIGEALGVAAEEAGNFGRELGNLPKPELPGRGGGELPGFQHGGYIAARPPYGVPIRVAEREGEFVIPESRMGGGGTSINVTMPISVSVGGDASGAGSPIGPQIRAEMDKWLRDNRGGFRGAIVRTAERG
jgi:hypothetical protein